MHLQKRSIVQEQSYFSMRNIDVVLKVFFRILFVQEQMVTLLIRPENRKQLSIKIWKWVGSELV